MNADSLAAFRDAYLIRYLRDIFDHFLAHDWEESHEYFLLDMRETGLDFVDEVIRQAFVAASS